MEEAAKLARAAEVRTGDGHLSRGVRRLSSADWAVPYYETDASTPGGWSVRRPVAWHGHALSESQAYRSPWASC